MENSCGRYHLYYQQKQLYDKMFIDGKNETYVATNNF